MKKATSFEASYRFKTDGIQEAMGSSPICSTQTAEIIDFSGFFAFLNNLPARLILGSIL